jgi:carbonic anhydrase
MMKSTGKTLSEMTTTHTNRWKNLVMSTMVLGVIALSSCAGGGTERAEATAETPSTPASTSPAYVTQTMESQSNITPDQAVAMLMEGNVRFTSGTMIQRKLMDQVNQTGKGQYPFAAVVSCIDSRIPTEMVFDQGVGDIFNARIAGNFVNTDILGSLEFAAKVAGSKAIVVLGHTECGAVKGACDHVELGNLTATLANIKPAVEGVTDITEDRTSKNPEFVQKVADLNVALTIEKIKRDSEVLREMYEKGELAIVGAMYDVHTGEVVLMN